MLEVRLLGQFDVLRDGKRLTIPTRNAQALFAFLVLNAGIAHRREKLAGLLWPDSSEENARSNLRHELWRLRKALETGGGTFFLVDDLTITFHPTGEFDLDVERLERPIPESDPVPALIKALSPYRGELLPGFYDEWVFVERSRLYALFEARVARLLELLQREARWAEVLDWAMRWIAMGQLPEPAYRSLMVAYASSGDISKAVATYERLAQELQKELGVRPSEQTQALYKRLRGGWKAESAVKPPAPGSPLAGQSTVIPSPKVPQSNLPRPLTSFIGREKEIQQVVQLVSAARLVTITGAGGVGKTRLAIQVGEALLAQFRDGVWWVELAALFKAASSQKWRGSQAVLDELADPIATDLVPQAVAKALRVQEMPGLTLLEALLEHLHRKQLLLILDNCEHLIEDCADLVERLLAACPDLTILATSREALGASGEKAWLLPSLSLPGRAPSSKATGSLQSEAISLFIERAGDVLPGYKPADIDLPTLAQLCLRLDGIPLAIELAAARMNMLSVQEIADRLDRRFVLLTSGRRTALPRHQTLQAAIEWSFDLLNETERVLLRRLSIFAGSFTLEAAEDICTGEEIPADDVLPLLGRLVAKSLLNVEPAPVDADLPTRYRFLDSICSFGRLRLDQASETRRMRDCHADYYLRLVEAAGSELQGPKQRLWLTRLKDEHDNLQSVLQWSLDTNDAERALKLAGSLWRYWWMHSHHTEGRAWLEKALSIPGPQPPGLRAVALNGAGVLARGQGDFEKAGAFLTECLEIQKSLGDKNGIANVQNSLGILAQLQQDHDNAIRYHQASLDYRREIGDKRGVAASLHNLSMIDQEKGEFSQAEELLNESLALFQQVNDARSVAATQLSLGYVMLEVGDVLRAEDFFRKSLVTMKDLGTRSDIIECLEGFAGVASLLQQPRRGALLLAAAGSLRQAIGIPVARYHQIHYQHIVEKITRQLDIVDQAMGKAGGELMSLEQAIEYALKRDG